MGNLRIAIISDIHGYTLALDRVLDDIEAVGINQIIVAGDIVESGPDPVGAMERMHALACPVIQGNTDYFISENEPEGKLDAWTMEQLGESGRQWLRDLPFSHRLSPPGARSAWDDLLVVHANPFDFYRAIPPDAEPEDLADLIGETEAAVLAFGHIHIAYIRELDRMTLLDVSAVGNPKDGDLRSKWGEAVWYEDTGRWTTELHYVEYPLEKTVTQMRESGMPNVEKHIQKLKRASYE